MNDLLCLVADKNIEACVRGLLGRPEALGAAAVTYDVYVHPRRDPGCFHEAHEFLRPLRPTAARGLVVFDRQWEGAPSQDAGVLAQSVRERLDQAGLSDWADVVVIDPELEVWVWSDSPQVEEHLGWRGRDPDLRVWLRQEGLWPADREKPPDPKLAVQRALEVVRRPRSSSIYRNLAASVSVERCADASFHRLRSRLCGWFPEQAP